MYLADEGLQMLLCYLALKEYEGLGQCLWQRAAVIACFTIDHLRNRQNFDLNKSRQKFHHSLKEHHKISNIPKFRCEML